MTKMLNLVTILVGITSLVSGVMCVLPHVMPHELMQYDHNAGRLWNTVTNMKMLPGVRHTLNYEVGVTARWHHFLQEHGNTALNNILADLNHYVQEVDRRDYNVGPRFRKFLSANSKAQVLPVSERGEQYVARRLVNAFADTWQQHHAAQQQAAWQAELDAIEHEESGGVMSGSEEEGDTATGPGQVVQAERSQRAGSASAGPSRRNQS